MSQKRFYAFRKRSLLWGARILDALGYAIRKPLSQKNVHPKKILVVRLDQLGDIIQTIPLLDSLKASFPQAKIHFLTTSLGAQVADVRPISDTVSIWDCSWFDKNRKSNRSLWDVFQWIRKESFDCALEPRGDIRMNLLLRWAGVKTIVGYGATGGGFLLDVDVPWEPTEHAIDKNLKLLRAIGGDISSRVPVLRVGSMPRSGLKTVAIHPDAGTSAKRWPKENFVDVIAGLRREGVKVVLVGVNKDLGDDIVSHFQNDVRNTMGRTNFRELVEILKECDGLLSNDSGPAHVMASLNKPVWVLWSGTADAEVWAPRGENIELFSHAVSCAPCSKAICPVPGHPCMAHISSEDVINRIRAAL